MRPVPEWIGKHHLEAIPPRVLVRVFEKYGGVCQCGCGRKIVSGEAWELDHIVALINGGEHRESNLQPLLYEHHKIKTRADVAQKSKSYEIRKRHIGIRRRPTFRGWRRFDGTAVRNPKLGTVD